MRFAADGSVDASFGSNGLVISDFGIKPPEIGPGRYKAAAVGLRSIVVDSLGRPLLTGGSVTKVINCSGTETAISTGFVARLTDSGTLDAGFGKGGLRQISDLSSFEQGSLFRGGGLFAVGLGKPRCAGEGGGPPVVLTGFGPEGNLDPGFGFAGFRAIGYPSAPVATVAPSGKIVLLGAKENGGQLVIRLLPNGAADPGFGRTGRIRLVGPKHAALAAVAVDRRGRLLFAGRSSKRVSKKKKNPLSRSTFLLARMNPEGSIDRSFGHKGSVKTGFGGPSSSFATQVMVDTRGRIVVGGGISTPLLGTGGGYAIARYLGGRSGTAALGDQLAGQLPLGVELFEVGLHRHRRHRQQLDRDVVPGLGEEGGAGALAALEGGEQATLAHLAVLDVLGELDGGVSDPGTVAGRHQLDLLALEQAQRIHVGGERAIAGRDDRRAEPEHEVAAEADAVLAEEADVVGGVAGGGEDAQAGVGLAALGEHDLGAEPVGAGGVVAMRVGEQDEPDPAAVGRRNPDRLQVSLVLGPGVDHDAGVSPVYVGVRPFQRHRPRVRGDDPQNLGMPGRLAHRLPGRRLLS
jgi:uncharacterized delta-60 repeat protein